ncbi:O-antigen ligase family protein [candidate division KSB1 bacterium]|nr:O-antigen ligase family protein [candidate division KSB1 bacterium]
MVFIIKNIVDTKAKVLRYVWVLIVLVLFLSLMAIRNIVTGENMIGKVGRVTMTGILGDPNDLALAVVIVVPFIYGFISAYRSAIIRFILIVTLLLRIHCIKATYSRGGLLGFGTVTFLFAILGRPRKIQLIVTGAMIFLVLLVVVGGFGMRDDDGAADSANSRFKLWEAGVRMAIASPIFGQGLSNFSFKSKAFSPSYPVNKTAHSIFFLVLGELGFVGLYFFCMLLFTELKMGWKLQRLAREYPRHSPYRAIARGCFPSFCGFIVCGLTLSQSYTWFPYIIIALTVVTTRVLAWEEGYQKYYHIVPMIDQKIDRRMRI